MAGSGCRLIVDAQDRSRYDVAMLDPIDESPKSWGTLRISLARVRLKRP